MKKRILMFTLVLMIVLSSFSITNALSSNIVHGTIPTMTPQAQAAWNQIMSETTLNDYFILSNNIGELYVFYDLDRVSDYRLVKVNGNIYLNNTNSQMCFVDGFSKSIYTFSESGNIYSSGKGAGFTLEMSVPGKTRWTFISANFPIYDLDYVDPSNPGTQMNDYVNPIKIISIKPSQRILFNYAAADKDKFLKSLSCTPNKSITVHQAYYSGGQVTDLVIKKDTTGNFIGGSPVTLASFPAHRALNTNEYLGYSQANGGNWVWTDYIPGSSGGPVGTDSNSLVTFTIDTRYCSYRVVSANTGLEITSGGIADVPQVPDDGIYNNNQNPWGPGDITDDYLLDRADYEDGILGDIQYGFDTIFKFLKMPFELLYKFVLTLGEIIQYALGTVSGFTTALQGIYAILPGPIWFLVIMAISINVFKLIFGR